MHGHTAPSWLCRFTEQWPSVSSGCGLGSHLEHCDPTEVPKALRLQLSHFSNGAMAICLLNGKCERSLGFPSSVLHTTPPSALSSVEDHGRRRKLGEVLEFTVMVFTHNSGPQKPEAEVTNDLESCYELERSARAT